VASVGWTMAGSGTFSIRTSWALYMTVARIGLPPENGLTLRQRANAQAMMPTKRLVGLGRRKNVI
jgi:hypothetical protein